MPRVSVFTPSHDPRYLDDCLQSMLAQTYQDWEWVVVLNDGARWSPGASAYDARIRVIVLDEITGVGAAKSYTCRATRGEILVELDHDDVLAADALTAVVDAFDENPDVGFVYSHTAQVSEALGVDPALFNSAHGWTYSSVVVDGRPILQCNSMDGSYPHNVSYIWYAPNHLRAFRRSVYEKVGGYDWHRTVLDDQDLMARLYQQTEFMLIDRCLYLQRVHGGNTQARQDTNARIQRETVEQYDANIQANALAWAGRRSLMAIDLGSAHNKPDGYIGLDLYDAPGVDMVGDVIGLLRQLKDDSVGVIRAVDFLEHISDRIGLFNEMHRVLAHGGMLLSVTPSTDGRGAFQDPTHVSFYNENAFWYFTDQETARYVPEITARFQVSRMFTGYPTPWHASNQIAYVTANLIALKDGPRMGGLLGWS